MKRETPLIDNTYLLEKYSGTGGWTYAEIPEIKPDPHTHFGWVRVRGFIDNYEIKQYHLMPMGNGNLFLPVKTAIRKKIGKQTGDYVHVVLFKDDSKFEIPHEIEECFELEDPIIRKNFEALSESNKKVYIAQIDDAKTIDTKAQRIANMIKRLQDGLGPYDQ